MTVDSSKRYASIPLRIDVVLPLRCLADGTEVTKRRGMQTYVVSRCITIYENGDGSGKGEGTTRKIVPAHGCVFLLRGSPTSSSVAEYSENFLVSVEVGVTEDILEALPLRLKSDK